MLRIIKRSGKYVECSFDKILARINKQSTDLPAVDAHKLSKDVIALLVDGIKTVEIDQQIARYSASLASHHPNYNTLATRISITSLHKTTDKTFSGCMRRLHNATYGKGKKKSANLLSPTFYEMSQKYAAVLDATIVKERDFNMDYVGFKTLEKSYLLKVDNQPAETPQFMFMRVALGIWAELLKEDPSYIQDVIETYEGISNGEFIHATPTLFNSGMPKPQMSSCFLLDIYDDSLDSIYHTLYDSAMISKYAGGIGISISRIRSKSSYIAGTNGTSNGIVPMLRVFDASANYVDQCFVEGTPIHTQDGTKQIQNLVPGQDMVYCTDGQLHYVKEIKKFEMTEEKIVRIKTDMDETVAVTPEHPFLVVKDAQHRPVKTIRRGLQNQFITPVWVPACCIETNDLIITIKQNDLKK